MKHKINMLALGDSIIRYTVQVKEHWWNKWHYIMDGNQPQLFRRDELRQLKVDFEKEWEESTEVDLEEEIRRWVHNPMLELTDKQENGEEPITTFISEFEDTARHFYELGLKARKGKED